MKSAGFYCKTPNCGAWIEVRIMPDDTMHSVTVVTEAKNPGPKKHTCPACKQTRDYDIREMKYQRVDGAGT